MTSNGDGDKFFVFLEALRKLCQEHGVTLAASGYDPLQVWTADEKLGPIHCHGIEDCTDKHCIDSQH